MRRVINLHQNIGRPRNPVTVQDILMAAPYTTTKRGTRYLLFDSGQDDADRVLVFCSEEQLKILCASNEIFADGTFKTVPNQFGQLYTIHGTVVDTAQRKPVFPLVSCICVRKNEATYQQIWEAFIDEAGRLNLQFKVNLLMTDFELAAMNVHQRAFPLAAHKGCLFHFNQALWRYVVNKGLRVLYINAEQEDHTVRRDVQRLMAIPFVPPDDAEPVFDQVVDELDDRVLGVAPWAWPPTWSRTTSEGIVRCGAAMPYRHVSPRNCGTCMNRPWTTPSAPTTWLRPTTRNSRN
ncbi:uncharacterized protein LOC117639119 [Thrips palmi]|uniref:Uncharacterized protein LOC117639119 n=1 Tax=Thrips palmi TaxID=161013 RepID=A0A6P8Y2A3_THRPL|nr:uncharacterized protein LOC117639119 [Thrips palmi]